MDTDLHFFDQHAAIKLHKDDENLKVVNQLRKEINSLRLNNKSSWNHNDRPRMTNFRTKSTYGL